MRWDIFWHGKYLKPFLMDQKIEKKNRTWQKIILGILAAGLIGWFGYNFYQDAGTSKLNVQSNRILTDTVHRGIFQEFIPVTGVIHPIKTVVIAAVEGGG